MLDGEKSKDNKELVPSEFYLGQNYPNPFRERTTIKYCTAYKTRVRLMVYDSIGTEVQKLVNEEQEAGTYEVEFSVRHLRESLPDGRAGRNPKDECYYYHLEAGNYKCEKQMILLK